MIRFSTILFLFSLFTLQAWGQRAKLVIPVGHTKMVTSMSLNDARSFLATSEDGAEIKIWDVETAKEMFTLHGHLETVNDLIFQPGSDFLFSASNDKTIAAWDVKRAVKRSSFTGHLDAVLCIAITQDGKTLISGSADGTIKFWDTAKGSRLSEIKASGPVHSIRLSTDEQFVYYGTRGGEVVKAEIKSGKSSFSYSVGVIVNDIEISPSGNTMVVCDNVGKVHTLNAATGKEIKSWQAFAIRARMASFLSDDQLIVIGRDMRQNIKWFDANKGQELPTVFTIPQLGPNRENFALGLVSFIRDDKNKVMYFHDYTGSVFGFDTEKKFIAKNFSGKAKAVNSISVDPTGRYLAIASDRKEPMVIDLMGNTDAKLLSAHRSSVKALAFHPHQPLLITGSTDSTLQVWNTDAWQVVNKFSAPSLFPETPIQFDSSAALFFKKNNFEGIDVFNTVTNKTTSIKQKEIFEYIMLPQGDRLIGRVTNTLTLIDVKKLKKGTKATIENLQSFAINKNGSLMAAAAGNRVDLFETNGLKLTKSIPMSDSVTATRVEFVPNKNQLITWTTVMGKFQATSDYSLRLWDIETGSLLATFRGHTNVISAIAFLQDKFLFSGANDGTIKVWSLTEAKNASVSKASLVPLDLQNWAVTTPIGLFDATAQAMQGMHYLQNAEVVQLDQLKQKYYEPNLLPKILGYNSEPIRAAPELTELALHPEINLLHPDLNNGELGIDLSDQGGGIGRIVILINDKEISQEVRGAVTNPELQDNNNINVKFKVGDHPYLTDGQVNKVSVKVYNKGGDLVSRTKSVYLIPDANTKKPQPKLFALLAGVSDYKGAELDLKFAAKDATDMAEALRISATKYFGESQLNIQLLTSDSEDKTKKPTKQNITNVLNEFAKTASANDVLFIYLSGHGASHGGDDNDFYYLTADAQSMKAIDDKSTRQAVALSSTEFINHLQKIPTVKQIMIIDACQSGKLAGDMVKPQTMSSDQVRALETMKDRTGLYVLAGSAADAYSYEASQYGQGLLTYSLLFGLKGPALRDKEFVDVMRLFQFATEKVPVLAAGVGGIQKPELRIPTEASTFDIGKLSESERGTIPISSPKPIFTRTELQEANEFFDVLDISVALDGALKEKDRSEAKEIVFVDERKFTDAYSIKGKYVKGDDGAINVTLRVFKNDKLSFGFEVKGKDAQEVVQAILTTALTRIKEYP